MNVEHAIAYLVVTVCAFVALAYARDVYVKRSRRTILAHDGAADLRALRSLRVGARLLLVLIGVLLAGLVVLYATLILEMDIWGYILGYGAWPWT